MGSSFFPSWGSSSCCSNRLEYGKDWMGRMGPSHHSVLLRVRGYVPVAGLLYRRFADLLPVHLEEPPVVQCCRIFDVFFS